MTQKADIGSKKLISLSPNAWARWLTNIANLKVQQIISSDFQWVSREGDVLLRVTSPETGEFLLLNELQLRYYDNMPRRMRAYTALAEEKYQCLVYPILINILQPSQNVIIASRYESNLLGITAHQDYKIINLWEVDVNLVFEQNINTLLPFVPVLKGGENETVIREALRILRQDSELNDLENLLAFFASFVLETNLIQQIMRWDMAILEQSPWYQQIKERGKQEGIQLGKQEGIIVGIQLALDLKFGEEGLKLLPEIKQINNLALLEAIMSHIKQVNSLEELRQIYQ